MVLAAAAAFGVPAFAQEDSGYIDDWSTHHLIFSNPGTEGAALANGTYAQWWKVTNDRRYVMQQARRNRGGQPDWLDWRGGLVRPDHLDHLDHPGHPGHPKGPGPEPDVPLIAKDWSVPMGGVTTAFTGTVGTLSSTSISGSSPVSSVYIVVCQPR